MESSEARASAHVAQLEETQNLIAELKNQLDAKVAQYELEKKERVALEIELSKVKGELVAQAEEVELTLLQLHQVQEELEHYFYQSRVKDELIKKHHALQQRTKMITSKFIAKK